MEDHLPVCCPHRSHPPCVPQCLWPCGCRPAIKKKHFTNIFSRTNGFRLLLSLSAWPLFSPSVPVHVRLTWSSDLFFQMVPPQSFLPQLQLLTLPPCHEPEQDFVTIGNSLKTLRFSLAKNNKHDTGKLLIRGTGFPSRAIWFPYQGVCRV